MSVLSLIQEIVRQELGRVRVGELGTEQRAAVASGAFTDQRGFRCEDAHRVIGTGFEAGDVVMIRGGRRVLLTMPGWATTCHNVADSDGDKLTSARLLALVEGLEAAYVADRHDNP